MEKSLFNHFGMITTTFQSETFQFQNKLIEAKSKPDVAPLLIAVFERLVVAVVVTSSSK